MIKFINMFYGLGTFAPNSGDEVAAVSDDEDDDDGTDDDDEVSEEESVRARLMTGAEDDDCDVLLLLFTAFRAADMVDVDEAADEDDKPENEINESRE